MAYLTIKKVNGCYYGYLQESYREGGKVRTRTVEYLGAVNPALAQQVQSTRKQLGQVDMAALVHSVRDACADATAAQASASPVTATASTSRAEAPPPFLPALYSAGDEGDTGAHDIDIFGAEPSTHKALITTAKAPLPAAPAFSKVHFPKDLGSYKISETALHRTHARFAQRLVDMNVASTAMPDITLTYGHPDGFCRNRDGSYTIIASRRTQNKRHQLNKTKLWQHTRQCLSLAYLDALANERPDLHHQLQSELDASHQATKRLLIGQLAKASGSIERLSLSLQLTVWSSVPQKLIKTQSAEEYGQASFETLKDWRTEAAFVLAEAHKSGWDGMRSRNTKVRRKHKSAITRKRNQIDRMGMMETIGARLSGKRRRLIREIMASEANLKSIDALECRQQVLRRHFPL